MSLTLLVTDTDGEQWDYECIGYERSMTGVLRVFVDDVKFIELEPDDYGGGPLVLMDWHELESDEEELWLN